ncbi:hypothetical protein [Streptomyces sp. NPDC056796]|uniref:hypothetical protein n=1 Tax=Streptomyces sp. NPDC056796 TaxID=3345947 RepID=UPI003682A805
MIQQFPGVGPCGQAERWADTFAAPQEALPGGMDGLSSGVGHVGAVRCTACCPLPFKEHVLVPGADGEAMVGRLYELRSGE